MWNQSLWTFSLPIRLSVRLTYVREKTLHLPVFVFYLNAYAYVYVYVLFLLKYAYVSISVYLYINTQADHAIACTCSGGHALLVKNPTFLSM